MGAPPLSLILSRHSLMPSYHPVVALLRPAQTPSFSRFRSSCSSPMIWLDTRKPRGVRAPALLRPLGQAVVGVNLQPCAHGVEAPAEAVFQTP